MARAMYFLTDYYLCDYIYISMTYVRRSACKTPLLHLSPLLHLLITFPQGERTPVRIRMSEPPASIPEHWTMCKSARNFRAAVAELTEPVNDAVVDRTMPFRKAVERKDGRSVRGEW